MKVLRMTDTDLRNKRVLIREDLNVPVQDGSVTSDARIRAALATIRYALDQHAKVFILSHLGRPKEGVYDPALSLAPVAARLSELLGKPVPLRKDWLDGVDCAAGSAVLCENVRFNTRREEGRASRWRAAWPRCATYSSWTPSAPRTAPRRAPTAWRASRRSPAPGRCWSANSRRSSVRLKKPARPLVAIVGGSKVSTKLMVLESLLERVDQLIVGGGIANTFLAATGVEVGRSLCETDMLDVARAPHGQGARARHGDSVAHRCRRGARVRLHRARRRARRERGAPR